MRLHSVAKAQDICVPTPCLLTSCGYNPSHLTLSYPKGLHNVRKFQKFETPLERSRGSS
jgi:hypothetical protein